MLSDLRFACRQIWKHRGLSFIAVLTIGLAIGANTAIFSVVNAVLIQPLPYPEPEQLVGIFETVPDGGRNSVSGGAFKDWVEHSSSFSHLAVFEGVELNLTGAGAPRRLSGLRVSSDFLSTLGVEPMLGRDFATGEDQVGGENHLVVLTHDLWQSQFGADDAVLGRVLTLDQQPHSVIGVLPPGALMEEPTSFLVPTVIDGDPHQWQRGGHWRSVVGRLLPTVTLGQAEQELRGIKQRLASEYPTFKEDWSVMVQPYQEIWAGNIRPTLMLLLGTVVLVMLIACANVSNLLLARGTARAREMAIRGALGAHAWRIVRQMLVESLALAAMGCGLGLILAAYGIELLAGLVLGRIPQALAPELDLSVLLFSVAAAAGCGLLFGVLPAWRAVHGSSHHELKESVRGSTSRSSARSQSALVIAEVAFTLVLLIAAGLFLRSFAELMSTDPGFDPDHTLAFDLSFPDASYPEAADRMGFIRELLTGLEALPGVESAGAGSALPLSNRGRTEFVSRSDEPERTDYVAGCTFVTGDYFRAMGMRLTRGRALTEADNSTEAARALVVDSTLVRDFYGDQDPIGESVRFLGENWQIVGVVEPVRHWVLDHDPQPAIYLPQAYETSSTSIVLRSRLNPAVLSDAVRGVVQGIDPMQPLANVRTLEQAVDRSLEARQATLSLLGFFAVIAVGLACIGIYGVMSFAVGRRAHELGIRSALGAQRSDVVRLVLRGGMSLSMVGVLLGLTAAWISARWLESQLFGIDAHDPWVFCGAVVLLVSVSALSVYWPARRAAGMGSLEALRSD